MQVCVGGGGPGGGGGVSGSAMLFFNRPLKKHFNIILSRNTSSLTIKRKHNHFVLQGRESRTG